MLVLVHPPPSRLLIRTPLLQQLLARLGITPDLPADEAAYAPEAPLTKQASMAFQNLRAPLTVMLGLGQRVGVGEDKSFRADLDGMVRAGMEGLSAVNPFALAWSQALPNIVNLVGVRRGDVLQYLFFCVHLAAVLSPCYFARFSATYGCRVRILSSFCVDSVGSRMRYHTVSSFFASRHVAQVESRQGEAQVASFVLRFGWTVSLSQG